MRTGHVFIPLFASLENTHRLLVVSPLSFFCISAEAWPCTCRRPQDPKRQIARQKMRKNDGPEARKKEMFQDHQHPASRGPLSNQLSVFQSLQVRRGSNKVFPAASVVDDAAAAAPAVAAAVLPPISPQPPRLKSGLGAPPLTTETESERLARMERELLMTGKTTAPAKFGVRTLYRTQPDEVGGTNNARAAVASSAGCENLFSRWEKGENWGKFPRPEERERKLLFAWNPFLADLSERKRGSSRIPVLCTPCCRAIICEARLYFPLPALKSFRGIYMLLHAIASSILLFKKFLFPARIAGIALPPGLLLFQPPALFFVRRPPIYVAQHL